MVSWYHTKQERGIGTMAKVKTIDMTLRLPEDLEQQVKAAIQISGISKHQFIINAIRDSLAGQVYQSLEAAQQVKEQLEGDRPITDVAIDIKNALDMLQAQIHSLKEDNKAIREEITKVKEEPEISFKVGQEVTRQANSKFSLLITSPAYTQEWAKDGGKFPDIYRYHYDLDIITRQFKTKSGRMAFKVVDVVTEEIQLSPEGHFISPLGKLGYDPEQWAKEKEEVSTRTGNKDPYKYQLKEDEEIVEDFETGITAQYLHETFGIDYKDLDKRRSFDICIEGVWTHFIKSGSDWNRTGYVRTINYEAKAIEGQIKELQEKLDKTNSKPQREAIRLQVKELEQKVQDLYNNALVGAK